MMDELMSRLADKPETVKESPTKTDANKEDGVRLEDLPEYEISESHSQDTLKSNKRTAVKIPPKPALKEKKFSSNDHSSNPGIPSSNENSTKELKKPKVPSSQGGGDAGTVSVGEETKSVDCKNEGTEITELNISNPQQAVTVIKEKQIQTDQTVSCLVFLNFIIFAPYRI